MTARWLNEQGQSRRAVLLFLLSAVLAVLAGFVWVKPTAVERLIVHGGYYYIVGVFALWLYSGVRVAMERRDVWTAWLRRPGWIAGFLIGATVFAIATDTFAHKVLFDEYVLQGTAWHMHRTKEISMPLRGYDFAGTWVVIDTFLDKRPYFFTFLVSLLHDLTGFRVANAFALNVALAFVTLGSTYWLVGALTGRRGPALLAVALLATLPLFGQNATGASMELLNLAMIAVAMIAATLYARAPSASRLSFLVLTAVLLAQTRYESVLFVLPVAAIVLYGWIRARRIVLSWPAIITPLLLVPYAWHDRFVTSKPILWQLREGDDARFGWRYLANNLEGAWNFFSAISPHQPNSLCLVIAGVAGLVWGVWRVVERFRQSRGARPRLAPVLVVTIAFALTIAANLGLLMFYYWSRLDEPIAARFALPFFLVLTLTAGWFAHSFEQRGIRTTRLLAYGLGGWLIAVGGPAYAQRLYTEYNPLMHEVEWELDQVKRRPGPILLITSKSGIPFFMEKIPALSHAFAARRAAQITWHLQQGTFREVLVSQIIRPSSAAGDLIVDPDDELPENFRLRPITQKRFAARWVRISSLIEITPTSNPDDSAAEARDAPAPR